MNSMVFPKRQPAQPEMASQVSPEMALADELIERVAKLVSMNVPNRQIAAASGIHADKIAEIIKLPKVQEKIQILTVEQLEETEVVNQGWDTVESEAVGTVLEQLRAVPDPDYALRAAAVANRAQRRGIVNETITGKTSAVAVIELSAVFIEKLQTMQIGMDAINTNAKRIDSLNVQDTQHLFQDTGKMNIDDLFGSKQVTVEGEVIE